MRPGKPPRRLPFKVYWDLFALSAQFLDEDTLIFTTPQWSVWQFDLRTSESQLLWSRKNRKKRK